MSRIKAAILTLGILTTFGMVAAQQDDSSTHDHGHEHAHEHGDGYRGARLVVADAGTNAVHVLDVDSAAVIGSFTVPGEGGGSIAVTDSGQYAIVAHRSANRISVIHSGLTSEDHGNHAHLLQGSPYVLATMNVGRQPTHLMPAGSNVLVFNDADGTIAILDENLFGLSLDYGLVEAAIPDHGAPLLIGEFVLAGYISTGSVDVFDADNNIVDSFEGCPGLHGAVLVGDTGVFGCSDGVLLAELHDDHFHWTHVANPAGSPEDARVGSFYGQYGNVAVGNFGSGLAFVDVEEGTFSTLELSASPFDAAVTGDAVVVATSDGDVSLVRVHGDHGHLDFTLEGVVSADVASGRPAVAVLGDRAFVTDPAGSQVQVLSIAGGSLEADGSISVPGNPSAIETLMLEGDFEWH